MNTIFVGPLAHELNAFLQHRRSLGYRYRRAEFTLRDFDSFLSKHVSKNPRWRLDQATLAWLSSKPNRKAVSVSNDAAVVRQFFAYLRRLPSRKVPQEPLWPRLPTESSFLPYFLSEQDIRRLLALCTDLKRPIFRAKLYRTLILVLYCTGLRFGEALQLRLRDVDTRAGVLFVETFKGRARWVPFHRSLARELERYVRLRTIHAPGTEDEHFFIGAHQRTLPARTAGETLSRLFKKAGLKPARGRIGPRPYDLRHAFAVHRLSRWYRQGADLHARLSWLSAYMGHTDIVGTETYLNATPELLQIAGNRLRRRYLGSIQEIGTHESKV